MKCKLLLLAMFLVNGINAQVLPKFENDTLFTKCGYKIYKGQQLKFGVGTGEEGRFKYLKIRGSDNPNKLKNKEITVKRVSDFYVSGLDNAYIKIRALIPKEDGTTKKIKFKLIFEKAIGDIPWIEPELIIPDEFRCKNHNSLATEIDKLYKLYQNGALTKEEFEKQKAKLLEH